MKKILFLNCCMRENSRTEKLARAYLDKIKNKHENRIVELLVPRLHISPLTAKSLAKRENNIASGRLNSYECKLARAFAAADEIIIAAPYWDSSFPSILKVFIEQISIKGITFECGNDGNPIKKCRANNLMYITTCGGFIGDNPSVKTYMQELCKWFVIDNFQFYSAQGLDIFPDKADKILNDTLYEMDRSLNQL